MLMVAAPLGFAAVEPTGRLEFDGVAFDVINRDGQPWLRASQVAAALQFDGGEAALLDLHRRQWLEFTEAMFARLPTGDRGTLERVAAFSPLGTYVAASLAESSMAPRFRRWLLEHIDGFWTGLARTAGRLDSITQEQAAELGQLRERIEILESERDRQAGELSRLGLQLERAGRVGPRRGPEVGSGDFAPDGLVPVYAGEIGGKPCQVVDVRDLRRFLGVSLYRILLDASGQPKELREGFRAWLGGSVLPELRVQEAALQGGEIPGSDGGPADEMSVSAQEKPIGFSGPPDANNAPIQRLESTVLLFQEAPIRVAIHDGQRRFALRDVLEALEVPKSWIRGILRGVPSKTPRIRADGTGRPESKALATDDLRGLLASKFRKRAKLAGKAAAFESWLARLAAAGGEAPTHRSAAVEQEAARPRAAEGDEPSLAERPSASLMAPHRQPEAGESPTAGRSRPQAPTPASAGPRLPDAGWTFRFDDHPVRVERREGVVWFIAKDAARAVGRNWPGFAGTFAGIPAAQRGYVTFPVGNNRMCALTVKGLRTFLELADRPKTLRFGLWLDESVLPELRRDEAKAVRAAGKPASPPEAPRKTVPPTPSGAAPAGLFQGRSIRIDVDGDGQRWFSTNDLREAFGFGRGSATLLSKWEEVSEGTLRAILAFGGAGGAACVLDEFLDKRERVEAMLAWLDQSNPVNQPPEATA